MMIARMMRGTAVVGMLAGALLVQGCSSTNPTVTAQGTRLLGSSGVSTGSVASSPYSGGDWDAALDAAMTSDNGGE